VAGWSNFAGWDSHPQEKRYLAWRTSNFGDLAAFGACIGNTGLNDAGTASKSA